MNNNITKTITNGTPRWYWFNKDSVNNCDWVKVNDDDNKALEEEYQVHLAGKRTSQRVYHCFGQSQITREGNGWTALVDFTLMRTFCGSGRCMCNRHGELGREHMTYNIKRVIEPTLQNNNVTNVVVVNKTPRWYWFNKDIVNCNWVKVNDEDNKSLEEEYQVHLAGKRTSQRVYHCFGNKWTALADFETMTTYCGSGRCGCHQPGQDPYHMTYNLHRDLA
jgi:hypothetical protein